MKKLFDVGAEFSREVSCAEHRRFGEFPCPWPQCPRGTEDQVLYQATLGSDGHSEYRRVEWECQGELSYTWVSERRSALFDAASTCSNEMARRFLSTHTLGTLYHYTDVAGLMGIIEECGLWLSDARFLNDRREIDHGMDIATRIVQQRIEVSDPEMAVLLTAVLRLLESRPWPRVCVASLSTKGDSLGQWRAYGSESGGRVAIGLKPLAGRLGTLHSCRLSPAIYAGDLQEAWLDALVSYHRNGLRHDQRHSKLEALRLPEEKFVEVLFRSILEQCACFKDPAFTDEDEWRYVFADTAGDIYELMGVKLLFRRSGHLVIPYVRMTDESSFAADDDPPSVFRGVPEGRLPLIEVVVGPQKDHELVKIGVKEFLVARGYDHVPVRSSAAPYRS